MTSFANYANKTVVVTGAASGIGQTTMQMLVDAGARVIAIDRNPVTANVALALTCDLTEPASIVETVKQIDSPIDVLLNIAGVPGTLEAETVLRVNVLGLRMLTDLLVDRINPGGAITNVASVAGAQWMSNIGEITRLLSTPDYDSGVAWIRDNPMTGKRAYDFSKECVVLFTKMQGRLLRERGIRTNSVSPGPIETPLLVDFKSSLGDALIDWTKDQTGRFGTTQDVARVLLFVSDPSLHWLNAVDIQIDGGLMGGMFGGWVDTGKLAQETTN